MTPGRRTLFDLMAKQKGDLKVASVWSLRQVSSIKMVWKFYVGKVLSRDGTMAEG